jgi:predicted nuclease of predicted toxin-antitoxin system
MQLLIGNINLEWFRELLDQNISFRVVRLLEKDFDNVKQVRELNLTDASDFQIWEFADKNNYTIVTFDSDFTDLANLYGSPPKIIWLRFGNSTNLKIANKLITKLVEIKEFISNAELSFLEID